MAEGNGSRTATLDDMKDERDLRHAADKELWQEISGVRTKLWAIDKKFTIGFIVLFLTSAGNLMQSSGLLSIILRALVSGG